MVHKHHMTSKLIYPLDVVPLGTRIEMTSFVKLVWAFY